MISMIRKLFLFYLPLFYVKDMFYRIVKICKESTIAGEIFLPFETSTRVPGVSRKG